MGPELDPDRVDRSALRSVNDAGAEDAGAARSGDQYENGGHQRPPMSKLYAPLVPRPSYRPKEIHELIETVARFNLYSSEELELYIKQQIAENIYDKDACLALLKLYQFNEDLRSPYIVLWIFILSLCALPDNGFNLCLYIHPAVADRPHLGRVIDLHECLVMGKYVNFWEILYGTEVGGFPEAESGTQLLADYINSIHPFFENKIREYITSQVTSAFASIRKYVIASYLRLTPDELAAWAESHNWHELPGNSDYYVISPGKDLTPASSSVKADLKFSQFTKIIGYSQFD